MIVNWQHVNPHFRQHSFDKRIHKISNNTYKIQLNHFVHTKTSSISRWK